MRALRAAIDTKDVKIKTLEETLSRTKAFAETLKNDFDESKRLLQGGTRDDGIINQRHVRANISIADLKGGFMKGYMQNQSRTKRTTSTNIAFSAYLSHDMQNVAKNVVIKCDRTILNDQNAYNPITGIFSAPVARVYLFSFSADTYTDAFMLVKRCVTNTLKIV
ncbi:hypothetical protein DPMN_112200 [Dreissena polymorpha]|uniref:C1q domain-containing protein n=1 Tax=Dreissena polymorpha TaxID=45954 RepID=A0A9D4QQN3_DREPO|nr:hypothetical protein DPMN_112200 [Dreissena polymorpha]